MAEFSADSHPLIATPMKSPNDQIRMPNQARSPKSEFVIGHSSFIRRSGLVILVLSLGLLISRTSRADHPVPSLYPISWELKFEHSIPRRVVVEIPGTSVPQAYWYMTYIVTNNTNQEQMFLPSFEMLTNDGKVLRSDLSIPARVFDAIKAREKRQFLEPYPVIHGEIRIGEDQAKDGVAIWPEPTSRMGSFGIFISGLSGEAVIVKDAKGEPMKNAEGKPIIVRKTLKLNYHIRGDEIYPGEDEVNEKEQEWVMR
jgi:hypothetical protein